MLNWIWPAALLILFAACDETEPVPTPVPGTSDATPPLVRLGSAGLRRDILLTQDSTLSQERRAKSTDDAALLATATDPETGVRRVAILGENRVVCIPQTGNTMVTIVDPIAEASAAPLGGNTLPGAMAQQFNLRDARQRAKCPSGTKFYERRLQLVAEAENGVGQVRRLPAAVVGSFGPDTVRVGTFNLHAPGNYPDDVFVRWGQTLGVRADVLLLTEVSQQRWAQLLAYSAGLPFVFWDGEDLAIASRGPIRKVQRHTIDPPGSLGSNNSNILYAQTDLDGFPFQVVATHWGIRDANDEPFFPESVKSSPSRLLAAQKILDLLDPQLPIAIVGGDFNAYSGLGPQRAPGSTAEVALMKSELTDTFEALSPVEHCSDQRIDYIFVQGPYEPVRYEACFEEANPSDHPFVLVTLE